MLKKFHYNSFLVRRFLLSLTDIMAEKVLFLGKIFGTEILIDLHFIRFHEFEIPIFNF